MKNEKQKRVNRQYDEAFKRQALELVSGGRTVAAVAKSLGIKAGVLYSWRSQAKQKRGLGKEGVNKEIKELKKRLKETEQERDILKKALSIFSRKT